MAKQEVGLKIDVDVQSVGNMKQQLRAATQELIAMNEKFGSSSKEATEAARRVASLKDAIGDAKALADTFNPDKKFVALGGAVQGAVAGFSALQGAMGLFGSESKEVEQLLLKVQSAMALQQGISGVAGAIDSFKLLAGQVATSNIVMKANAVATNLTTGAMRALGISVNTTSTSFRVLKAAIVSTGIGALVVAIGFAVEALMNLADSSDEAAQAQKKLEKAEKDAAAAIEMQNKMLQNQISLVDRNTQVAAKRAQAAGKSEEEVTKITRDGILKRKKILEDDLANRSTSDEQYFKKLEDLRKVNNELEDFDLDQQIKRTQELKNTDDAFIKEKQNAQKQLTDFIKAENEKRLLAGMTENEKELFDFRKKFVEKLAIAKKYNLDIKGLEELRFKEGLDIINQQTAEETINTEKRSALSKFLISDSINDLKASLPVRAEIGSNIVALQQKQAESTAKLTEAEIASREQLLASSANILGELSKLFGESTAAGKAAALAEIIINTGLGFANGLRIAQQGAAATGPAAPFAFPIFYATQVAAVLSAIGRARQILTQVKGGGGGVPPNAPPPNLTAPVTPALAPQVVATQVNTAAVNQMGNRAARAYVLNSDIQNDNQRNAYIDRSASIG